MLLFRISTIAPESMNFHLQNFSSIETSILLYQIFLPTNTDISTCFQIPFVTIAYFKKRSIWIPLCKLQPNFCLPYCRLLLLHCLQISMCILGLVQFSYTRTYLYFPSGLQPDSRNNRRSWNVNSISRSTGIYLTSNKGSLWCNN